jgi:MarR family transcriptional regulator, organic hydroperoxide resistance regulator
MDAGSDHSEDADLLQTLLRQLREVATVAGLRTRGVLDEFGLNETSAGVLWMLDPSQPPATMRELARRIGCDPSNVTLISGKLEQAGLTFREVNPSDGRSRLLSLTSAGLETRARLLDRLLRDTPLAALSRQEQHHLTALLAKLGAAP